MPQTSMACSQDLEESVFDVEFLLWYHTKLLQPEGDN